MTLREAVVFRQEEGGPREVVTPTGVALLLAYVHKVRPVYLDRNRLFRPYDLRAMASWLGEVQAGLRGLRSVRQQRQLAAYIVLLEGLGLLEHTAAWWYVSPLAGKWLHASVTEQWKQMADTIGGDRWLEIVAEWGVGETLTVDFVVYLQQQCLRQYEQGGDLPTAVGGAQMVTEAGDGAESLTLSLAMPLAGWLLFDLLQMGSWSPTDHFLTLTPLSVAEAVQKGYSVRGMMWLWQQATGTRPKGAVAACLQTWAKRADMFQVRLVPLLTAKKPEALAAVLRNRRLQKLGAAEMVSSRAAAIPMSWLEPLQTHLAAAGFPLALDSLVLDGASLGEDSLAQTWLAVRVLVGLGQILPLPWPVPASLLDTLTAQLAPEWVGTLSMLADELLAVVEAGIHGRDVFWPAEREPDPAWLPCLRQAIEADKSLEICYQAVGEREARWRRVQPLRCWSRGTLHYFEAFCERQERCLTFRLDRISEISMRDER